MKTLRLNASDQAAIAQAAEIIRAGGLVAFPTETVYGLGANALDAEAVRKIFEAKERPAWDPVIVHLASLEMLPMVASRLRDEHAILANTFMPGPLTLLLPKLPAVPSEVTAGRELVGVRIPDHYVARKLIFRAGVPVAAPSANRFGAVSPTTAEHVLADLDGRIDAVLDGGPTNIGVESTVLDVTTSPATILRQGGLTRERLEAVIGPVQLATAKPPESAQGLASPGLSERHYAPRTSIIIAAGDPESLSAEAGKHTRAGIMLPSGWQAPGVSFDWGKWGDWETLGNRLYAGLRWLDAQGLDVILVPLPPDEDLGSAIRDRLQRAARG